jgi:peptide/nickel transport system substrate-binding protein
MKPDFFRSAARSLAILGLLTVAIPAVADSSYGIAMYGAPALPPDFVSLPYANPNAPQGGSIVTGESGSFDSLNPYILKGSAPYWLGPLTVETLMGRSYDEPFTLYGLLAESINTPPDRSWVEFTLNPKARFSDGHPVTVEDVIWSFETLGTKGSPRYWGAWKKIAKAEQTGPLTVRFTFNTPDRELPLILGLRPILEKAQWQGKDFAASSLEAPIGSGPYVVDKMEPGRFISFKKNPNWWGKDLPFNRGQWNLSEIRYDYFTDANVVFEAFKGGTLTSYRETSPAKWVSNYDFPAVKSGAITLSEIPDHRPSGIQGLVMNTRKPIFADWRVREALIDAFNYEFINRTVNGGTDPRITSYYLNSILGMSHGPATGTVLADLKPFAASLLPGAIEGYSLPVSDGTEANRGNLRKAMHLLEKAGWTIQNGVLCNAKGEDFTFSILLPQGASVMQSAVNIYIAALKRLGITATVSTVDSAQYVARTQSYDFDMTQYEVSLSLSPGNEQWLYWGKDGVTNPGTRNLMGMNSPAAEAMITKLLTSASHDDFIAATRALDRILTSGRYVIPVWYSNVSRIAHIRQLKYPAKLPVYGDWTGFQPNVWWYQD